MKQMMILGLILTFVSVSFAADSPLMEAAKKERARRAALKPGRSFTNKDIEEFKAKHKEWANETPPAEDQSVAVPESKPATSMTQDVRETEEYWRARYEETVKAVDDAKKKVDQIQSDINALTQAFYAESDGVAQRPLIESERTQRIQDLEAAKRDLSDAEQAMDDLQDEAHAADVPPGWVRD